MRLEEVLELVRSSRNCSRALKNFIDGIIRLDGDLSQYDVNDYEELFDTDNTELVDLIEDTLGIDVSDVWAE